MERDNDRQHELVEDLLAERAPAIMGDLSEDEVEIAQAVAFLKAARPEALQPDPIFVEDLRKRLFEASTSSGAGGPAVAKVWPPVSTAASAPATTRPARSRSLPSSPPGHTGGHSGGRVRSGRCRGPCRCRY